MPRGVYARAPKETANPSGSPEKDPPKKASPKKPKKIIKKAPKKSREATSGNSKGSGDKSWKVAEREVAEYFGTTRAGMGQKGHDTREVPVVENWLQEKAPAMRLEKFGFPVPPERFSHVFIESKCQKQLMPTLERWSNIVRSNPDKKLLPMMAMGELSEGGLKSDLTGFCRLEDFPTVYRGFLAPPTTTPTEVWFANLLNRFWIVRQPLSVNETIVKAIEQCEANATAWQLKRVLGDHTQTVSPLSVVYLKYPKHLVPALVFRIPS